MMRQEQCEVLDHFCPGPHGLGFMWGAERVQHHSPSKGRERAHHPQSHTQWHTWVRADNGVGTHHMYCWLSILSSMEQKSIGYAMSV
jgi:hypothetical protein